MKKIILLGTVVMFSIIMLSCEDESEDPPEFTNGLMVEIGQNPQNNGGLESTKPFTATRFVECSRKVYPGSEVYTFSAQTSENETWTVKFQWQEGVDDSIIYINESGYNKIELKSPVVGDYYINNSSSQADETFIKLLEIKPDTIIKAEFEGFIYKSGSPAVPDTLKEGYFVTKNFVLDKKEK